MKKTRTVTELFAENSDPIWDPEALLALLGTPRPRLINKTYIRKYSSPYPWTMKVINVQWSSFGEHSSHLCLRLPRWHVETNPCTCETCVCYYVSTWTLQGCSRGCRWEWVSRWYSSWWYFFTRRRGMLHHIWKWLVSFISLYFYLYKILKVVVTDLKILK